MSTLNARIDLPPTPRSVVAARRVVREALGAWGAPQDRADAELLATELVANVVDHVGGEVSFGLEVTLSDRWLRIAVADGSASAPSSRSSPVTVHGGVGCSWSPPSPTAGASRTATAARWSGSSCRRTPPATSGVWRRGGAGTARGTETAGRRSRRDDRAQ
jgi:hypothetical protein